MSYKQAEKGHYYKTVPRTFHNDITVHIIRNTRAVSYVGNDVWQVMIDDSTIDKKGRSLGYYATYKQAKAVAKQHVENMLLDMAIKQAELLN
jgi:hypothetical protein|tara:strand:- start:4221 stop:4496 length:276 start_codon:yes stop_codon:yes gene_type:complete